MSLPNAKVMQCSAQQNPRSKPTAALEALEKMVGEKLRPAVANLASLQPTRSAR